MSGIYIHIPFCKQACSYCNFHFSTSLGKKTAFLDALHTEMSMSRQLLQDMGTIDTVYFGGGTPSILESGELEKVLHHIHQYAHVSGDAEITLEANPDDISREKLKAWHNIGFNRLSVGLQSFDDAELAWMNRSHDAAHSMACLNEIRDSDFTNYSVDLIYGSPLQSLDQLNDNLQTLFKYHVPHISCYALTVEPKTILQKRVDEQSSAPTDPEKQSEQFLFLMKRMREQGYDHYEISNYALPGMHSRHNSSYWQGKPYKGLGPSAHSFDGKHQRSWNMANNSLYIQSLAKGQLPSEEEILTPKQQLNEYIMTSLRTSEGIHIDRVAELFGIENARRLLIQSKKYIDSGKVIHAGSQLVLSDEGKLFADGIAGDLFF